MLLASQKKTKAGRNNTTKEKEMRSSCRCRCTPTCISRGHRKQKETRENKPCLGFAPKVKNSPVHAAHAQTCTSPQTKSEAAPAPQEDAQARMLQNWEVPWTWGPLCRGRALWLCPERTENSLKEILCGVREKGWVKKDILSYPPPLVCVFLQRVRQCGVLLYEKELNKERTNTVGPQDAGVGQQGGRWMKLWGEEMQVRWRSCFQWESKELDSHYQGQSLSEDTSTETFSMGPPTPPSPNTTTTTTIATTHLKLKIHDSCFLSPFIWLFLFLFGRGMAIPTKQKLSAWEFWKNDIFPRTKSSLHLSQLWYIDVASTRHCPTAFMAGWGGRLTDPCEKYGQ